LGTALVASGGMFIRSARTLIKRLRQWNTGLPGKSYPEA